MALTTLANVKSWLGITTSDSDTLLTNLINQISIAILNYLQRPALGRTTYTEVRSGVGNQQITLRNWPVVGVTSLTEGASTIAARSGIGQSGYALSTWDGTTAGNPQEITLQGYYFCRGLNNIQIVYDAGYCATNEAHTVPASPYTVTANQTYGTWAQNDGVTYANGTALTVVPSSPSVGQYSVSAGVYTFSVADQGAAILLNYSYTPAPLEEACIEWVGERYRYKSRIGQVSQSLGGTETASYNLKMPDHITTLLEPYRKSFPL